MRPSFSFGSRYGRLLGLALGLAATGTAYAGVYTFGLGSFGPFDNTTGSTHNFAVAADGPVRGYYVSGDWTRNTGTSAASLMRTIIGDGTTTWAAAHMGGHTTSTVTAWTFGQFSNRANNSAFNDPATPAGGLTGNIFSGNANANYSLTFRSGSATMTSSMANASAHLLTDAVAPMSGDLNSPQGTFARPITLTTQQTLTTYRYNAHSFVAPTSGTFMVAGNWFAGPASTNFYDGHLELYEGSFDPNNPLLNLVGVDDDGMPVPPGVSIFNSSAMWLNLTGGQTYIAVATTFASGSTGAVNPYSLYVAGPVPEPATIAFLGFGVAALVARRRRGRA
ncbi:MAG: PEP-CTERM sorting domain-containing protein [Fimbriimonadaceae bacterium]